MIHLSTLLQHYKRPEIQNEIIFNAKGREIAVKYGEKGFGRRPDVLNYPNDILELAKQGATSLHASEERWSNPLSLDVSMRREDMDKLRLGWDLVLDIDCRFLDYSKIAASLTVQALQFHEIKGISCKFSGNKGFHIGIPYEAFPQSMGRQQTRELFPEAPRRIALYIREMIKKPLGEKILELEGGDFGLILKKTSLEEGKVKFFRRDSLGTRMPYLNVEPFLDIDTLLISSRHLYRMPYSFNEKSGLVSVPIDPNRIMQFKKEQAKHPVKVERYRFLDASQTKPGEARKLIVQAFDHAVKEPESEKIPQKRQFSVPETAIPEKFFPICIQEGLKGLRDGRKRFLFVLTNFLASVGWDYDQIEKRILEWNKCNPEPLREVYIVGHLRYHKQRKQKILPPNCDNELYYGFLPKCRADPGHAGIKNPVQWARRRARMADYDRPEKPARKRRKAQAESEE